MNVLFVVENYHPHIGGVEVVFRNLAEGLARKGHGVTVLTHHLKGTKREETVGGVRIVRVGSSRYSFSFAAIPQAIALAKKADVIHTTTFNGTLPARIAGWLCGKKVVITVHEVWIGKWGKLSDVGRVSAFLHDVAERFIYLLPYDYYVTVSESTKRQVLSLGVDKRKVQRVYNAVDYAHFDARKYTKAVRSKLKLGRKFVYLAYGRPGVSKGMQYVVDAAKMVQEKVPDSMLLLMLSTDPAYQKQYARLAKKLSRMSVSAKLLPSVAWSEVPKYVKAADCVVVPSLAEGFGYTAAEACAMDVPVVATDTTSLPEVVSGKYVLVKPKSAKALAEGIVAVSNGKYTKSPLRKFTLKENIEGYLAVYRKISGK